MDHDIDKIISLGQEMAPDTERNHSTSDAVFIGGLVADSSPISGLPDNSAVIATEGGAVYIAVTADKLVLHGNVEVDGSLTATGDVMAGNVSLSHHVHGGVETGPGSTGGPS